MKTLPILLVLPFFLTPLLVGAHPGNTDSYGCHTCKTNCSDWGLSYGEYHCHNAKSSYQPEEPIRSHYGDYGTGYTEPWPDYSYPSFYYSTPSCPTNSYYDGISSCKCNYGYVVSGSSCVSADSLCYDQLGYSSSYDSLSNSCKCNYGYVIGDYGQCVSGNLYCSGKLGLMSEYNSVTKKCQCMTGYEYDGSSCVYESIDYSASLYAPLSTYCPSNSTAIGTQCYCNSGYIASGNVCVQLQNKITPASATISDPIDLCIQKLGPHGIVAGQNLCGCAQGYTMNDPKNSCDPIITSPAKKESSATATRDTPNDNKTSDNQKPATEPSKKMQNTTPNAKTVSKTKIDGESAILNATTSSAIKKNTEHSFSSKISSWLKWLFK